jgi:hypothetical protein
MGFILFRNIGSTASLIGLENSSVYVRHFFTWVGRHA